MQRKNERKERRERQKYEKQRKVYTRVKKNQLDEQLILSIFLKPLHVSGVSRPINRTYYLMYITICTFYSF